MSSPKSMMPSFNIFVMMNSPEKKEKKEKKGKAENKLAEALKTSGKKDDEMISHMKEMAAKMAATSHVGGG